MTPELIDQYRAERAKGYSAVTAWSIVRSRTSKAVAWKLRGYPEIRGPWTRTVWEVEGMVLVLQMDIDSDSMIGTDWYSTRTERVPHGVNRNTDDFMLENSWSRGGLQLIYTLGYGRAERAADLQKRGYARGPAWELAREALKEDAECLREFIRGDWYDVMFKVTLGDDDEDAYYHDSSAYSNDLEGLRTEAYDALESALVYFRSSKEAA